VPDFALDIMGVMRDASEAWAPRCRASSRKHIATIFSAVFRRATSCRRKFPQFRERRQRARVGLIGRQHGKRSSGEPLQPGTQAANQKRNAQQQSARKTTRRRDMMKRTIIALLATTAMAVPAFAADSTAPQAQQPSMQQQQQPQPSQQSQAKPQDMQQQQQQAQAQPQNGNQPIPPNSLSRSEVKQMQQALNQDGFNAGKPDGKLGRHTRQALQKFDQQKGIQSKNGQLTEQTLAQLGVNQNQDQSQQPQDQNGQPNDQENGNGQNGAGQNGNGQ
jgi:hypothetical protein